MSAHWYDKLNNLVPAWVKGAWPSVSTILDRIKSEEYLALVRRVGIEKADEIMRIASERGTRIHLATHKLELGVPDWDIELEEGDWFYIPGYLAWHERIKPELVASEKTVRSEKYKYAGQIDRKYIIDGELWIVDLKTGQDSVRHGLQLKGYQVADMEETGVRARMAVLGIFSSVTGAGYRNVQQPYGLLEYKESLASWLHHVHVFRWWHKKLPVARPVDVVCVLGPLGTLEVSGV